MLVPDGEVMAAALLAIVWLGTVCCLLRRREHIEYYNVSFKGACALF
jgi:hypothetical protein